MTNPVSSEKLGDCDLTHDIVKKSSGSNSESSIGSVAPDQSPDWRRGEHAINVGEMMIIGTTLWYGCIPAAK